MNSLWSISNIKRKALEARERATASLADARNRTEGFAKLAQQALIKAAEQEESDEDTLDEHEEDGSESKHSENDFSDLHDEHDRHNDEHNDHSVQHTESEVENHRERDDLRIWGNETDPGAQLQQVQLNSPFYKHGSQVLEGRDFDASLAQNNSDVHNNHFNASKENYETHPDGKFQNQPDGALFSDPHAGVTFGKATLDSAFTSPELENSNEFQISPLYEVSSGSHLLTGDDLLDEKTDSPEKNQRPSNFIQTFQTGTTKPKFSNFFGSIRAGLDQTLATDAVRNRLRTMFEDDVDEDESMGDTFEVSHEAFIALRKRLVTLEKEKDSIQKNYQHLEEQYDEVAETRDIFEGEMQFYKNKVNQLQDKLDALEKKGPKSEGGDLNQLLEENAARDFPKTSSILGSNDNDQQSLVELEVIISILQKETLDKDTKINDLREINERQQLQISNLKDAMNTTSSRLEMELQQITVENMNLKSKLSQLESSENDKDDLLHRIQFFETENSRLENHNINLSQQNEALLKDVETLRKENDNLLEIGHEKEKAMKATEEANNKEQIELMEEVNLLTSQKKGLEKDLKSYVRQINEIAEENKRLRNANNDISKDRAQLEKDMKVLRQEIVEKPESMNLDPSISEDKLGEMRLLQDQLISFEARINSLLQDNINLEQRESELKIQCKDLEEIIRALENKTEEDKKNLKHFSELNIALADENNNVKIQLKTLQDSQEDNVIVEESRRRFDELEKANVLLLKKLEESRSYVDELLQKQHNYENEIQSLQQKIAESTNAITTANSSLDETAEQVEKNTLILRQLEEYRSYIDELVQKQQNYENEIQSLQQNTAKSTDAIATADRSLSDTAEQSEGHVLLLLRQLEESRSYVDELVQKQRNYESEIHSLKQRIAEATADMNLDDTKERSDLLTKKIEDLENELKLEKEKNISYLEMIENLESSLEEFRHLYKEVSDEYFSHQARTRELDERTSTEIRDLQENFKSQMKVLDEMTDHNNSLRANINNITAELSENKKKLQEQAEIFEDEKIRMVDEMQHLKTDYEKTTTDIFLLNETNAKLTENKSQLEASIIELEMQVSEFRHIKESMSQTIASNQDALSVKDEEIESHMREVDALRRRIEQLEFEKPILSTTTDSKVSGTERFEDVSELRSKIQELEEDITMVEEERTLISDARDKLMNDYKQLEKEFEHLKGEHHALKAEYENQSLETRSDPSKITDASLLEEIDLLRAEVNSVQECLTKEREIKQSFEVEREKFKKKYKELKKELKDNNAAKIVQDLQDAFANYLGAEYCGSNPDVNNLVMEVFENLRISQEKVQLLEKKIEDMSRFCAQSSIMGSLGVDSNTIPSGDETSIKSGNDSETSAKEVEVLRQRIAALENEINSDVISKDIREELGNTLESHQNQLEEKNRKIIELEATIQKLQKLIDSVERTARNEEKANFEELLSEMESDMEDTRAMLMDERKIRQESEKELHHYMELCEKLNADLEQAHLHYEEAQEKMLILEEKGFHAQEELYEVKAITLNKYIESEKLLQKEVNELNAVNTEYKKKIKSLEDQLGDIKSDMITVKQALKDSQKDCHVFSLTSENLQRVLEEFQIQKEVEIEHERAEAEKKVSMLKVEIEKAESLVKTLNKELEELRTYKEAVTHDLINYRAEITHMQDNQVQLRQELEKSLARWENPESDQEIVDRRVVKQLVVRYFESNASRKRDVLELLSRMLNFSEEEKVKAGLKKKNLKELMGDFVNANPRLPNGESVGDKWIEFLMTETDPDNQEKDNF